MRTRIAILDDEARMAEVLAMILRADGYDAEPFFHPQQFFTRWNEDQAWDLLITDLKMPTIDGLEVLARINGAIPVILMTAHATIKTAVDAMRQGAFDYIEKPIDNDACLAIVKRALSMSRLTRENKYLRREISDRHGLDTLIAASPAMQAVMDLARRAARGHVSVLITGPSGTGKEVVARAIHTYSPRLGQPFVAVNCKAFAESLLESELFGHEKGAFTGADQARAGIFERADGGTLFLDEIGEVSESFQAKLLRVLQDGEVWRVGANKPRPVNVRIVAATNRPLDPSLPSPSFRQDLYYRLAVLPISLPPLKNRPEDILPLARHFLTRAATEAGRTFSGWTPEAEHLLYSYPWPGNVRELENAIERAVLLSRSHQIEASDLLLNPHSNTLHQNPTPHDISSFGLAERLDRVTESCVRAALSATKGLRQDAARLLGIERTTLYRLIKKFHIDDDTSNTQPLIEKTK